MTKRIPYSSKEAPLCPPKRKLSDVYPYVFDVRHSIVLEALVVTVATLVHARLVRPTEEPPVGANGRRDDIAMGENYHGLWIVNVNYANEQGSGRPAVDIDADCSPSAGRLLTRIQVLYKVHALAWRTVRQQSELPMGFACCGRCPATDCIVVLEEVVSM